MKKLWQKTFFLVSLFQCSLLHCKVSSRVPPRVHNREEYCYNAQDEYYSYDVQNHCHRWRYSHCNWCVVLFLFIREIWNSLNRKKNQQLARINTNLEIIYYIGFNMLVFTLTRTFPTTHGSNICVGVHENRRTISSAWIAFFTFRWVFSHFIKGEKVCWASHFRCSVDLCTVDTSNGHREKHNQIDDRGRHFPFHHVQHAATNWQ